MVLEFHLEEPNLPEFHWELVNVTLGGGEVKVNWIMLLLCLQFFNHNPTNFPEAFLSPLTSYLLSYQPSPGGFCFPLVQLQEVFWFF